ncbi:PH domain-containing protein [Micromonospora sp. NPDC049801]|uniref:PH domain-containing protein n=1 Tax=unclassified Micromonospora TaxID=2617518 RepID=UPI003405A35C
MRRWRRMDPWGLTQAVTGLMVVVGSVVGLAMLAGVGSALLRGDLDPRDDVGVFTVFPFLGLWLTGVTRMYLTGIYVNDEGVRLRHISRTRTFPWSEVTGFEARPALFLGGPTVRLACWVRTTGGAFESSVQRRSRKGGWRKNSGPVLAPDDFEGMLARLDAERASRRSGPQAVRR